MFGRGMILVAAVAATAALVGCDSGSDEATATTAPVDTVWNPDPVDASKIAGLYWIDKVSGPVADQIHDYHYLHIDNAGNLAPYNYMSDDVDSLGPCYRQPVSGETNFDLIGVRLGYDAATNAFYTPAFKGVENDRFEWLLDESGNLKAVQVAGDQDSTIQICWTSAAGGNACLSTRKATSTTIDGVLANLCR